MTSRKLFYAVVPEGFAVIVQGKIFVQELNQKLI